MNSINSVEQLNNINKGSFSRNIYPNLNLPEVEISSLNFGDIFKGKILDNSMFEEIKLSKHAAERMNSRNISFSENDIKDLGNAIKKAEDKGSKESLILLNDVALIVSVRNRTVITAMTRESLKDNVVTNIDSTIVI
jgi:flagellar operon protein